jgi:hypothetical protein
MRDREVPFSLDWLAEAARNEPQLSVCDLGHLVVRGNTHWSPQGFSADRRALICRIADPHT